MDVDANLYQDVTEIADADATQVVDVQLIQVVVLAETTAAYGLSFFLFSAEDAAAILLAVTDAAATTAVSGSFSFLSSAEDAATILLAVMVVATIVADAMTVAANITNKRNFEDGSGRPFCMRCYNFYLLS